MLLLLWLDLVLFVQNFTFSGNRRIRGRFFSEVNAFILRRRRKEEAVWINLTWNKAKVKLSELSTMHFKWLCGILQGRIIHRKRIWTTYLYSKTSRTSFSWFEVSALCRSPDSGAAVNRSNEFDGVVEHCLKFFEVTFSIWSRVNDIGGDQSWKKRIKTFVWMNSKTILPFLMLQIEILTFSFRLFIRWSDLDRGWKIHRGRRREYRVISESL